MKTSHLASSIVVSTYFWSPATVRTEAQSTTDEIGPCQYAFNFVNYQVVDYYCKLNLLKLNNKY